MTSTTSASANVRRQRATTAASPVVARSAVLPGRALDDLRCERTYELITSVIAETGALREEGDELADELYPLIGETSGPAKGRLVAVRRALHNGRRPEPGSLRPGELPPSVAGRVESWMARWDECDRARRALPEALAAEQDAATGRLRDLAAHPPVRHALSHASPDLSTELEKWLADPHRRPRRRALTSLARYVSRAATKTSPFSTFTTIHIAQWAQRGPAIDLPNRDAEPQVVLEADAGFVRLLEHGLHRYLGAAGGRPVRLSPTVWFGEHGVSFTGPGPKETIRETRSTGPLRALAKLLEDSPGITLEALVRRLAVAGDERPETVRQLLEDVERGGFIEVTSGVPDQSARPIAELADGVACGSPLEGTLHALQRELDGVAPIGSGAPDASACERATTTIRELLNTLSLPDMDHADLRKHVLHESYLPREIATCGLSTWSDAVADLDAVRRWLAVHDPMLPFRLALGTYFRRRFGPGARVPLLEAHRVLSADLDRTSSSTDAILDVLGTSFLTATDPLGTSGEPRLRRLRELRRSALARFTFDKPTGTLHASAPDLHAAARSWPSWVRDPGPLACYVQSVSGEGPDATFVLNAAHGGHGKGRGRWTRLSPAQGWPRTEARPGAPVPAELPGVFGHSVNVRAPGTGYEIDQPQAVGSLPPERRLGLDGLVIRHDPEHDLVDLWSSELGAPVLPVHGGMMSDALLPPLARLLVYGFGTTYLTHSTLPAVEGIPDRAGAGVSYRPRVMAGRIALARARWIVRASRVPARCTSEPEANYLLRLASWLTECGIPHRFYVRAWNRGMAREDLAFDRSHKPLYVDVGNPLLVATFDKMLAGSLTDVEFTEPFPDPGNGGNPEYSTEFVVELPEEGAGETHGT